ncbi:response regulator [Mesorhizobium sp. B2-4-12]|uniref:response regulator transcription factor n=2 Tax=unclassified Mesorhizobium TaxID=325217 RepID=UPI001FEFB24E|nr:response regulator [Mesorhizobium sp. B2-4-12]
MAFLVQIKLEREELGIVCRHDWLERAVGGSMTKKQLVSVVDDDRYFRESMRRLIKSLGYFAEAFASPAELLASPYLAETGCLIADINMPEMTGIELFRHLVEQESTIPTILVTAYPDDADQIRAANDGVLCYLRKPVDEQKLTECLRAALTRAEQA